MQLSYQIKLASIEGHALSSSSRLKKLNIRFNELTTVPHDLPTSLEELDLSQNKIMSLKHGVCATQEQLRLSFGGDGAASQVGSPLAHLIHLRKLDLHGNKISTICVDDFIGLEELRVDNRLY